MDVALTIDVETPDRPCQPGNFLRLMAMLRGERAPATLFVNGGWFSEAEEAEVEAIKHSEMLVGIHSHAHVRFGSLSGERIGEELELAAASLTSRGLSPTRPLFRLPFLDGDRDAFVLQTVASLGWWHVHFQAGNDDWKAELRAQPDRVARLCLGDIERAVLAGRASAIVLAHSWPDPTVEALRQVIVARRQAGDVLVSVLDLPRQAWSFDPERRPPPPSEPRWTRLRRRWRGQGEGEDTAPKR